MTGTAEQPVTPWMAPLSGESRDAVRRNIAQAPKLTDRQRERLRLLFRPPSGNGAAPQQASA